MLFLPLISEYLLQFLTRCLIEENATIFHVISATRLKMFIFLNVMSFSFSWQKYLKVKRRRELDILHRACIRFRTVKNGL